jgi:hypothetical protein
VVRAWRSLGKGRFVDRHEAAGWKQAASQCEEIRAAQIVAGAREKDSTDLTGLAHLRERNLLRRKIEGFADRVQDAFV